MGRLSNSRKTRNHALYLQVLCAWAPYLRKIGKGSCMSDKSIRIKYGESNHWRLGYWFACRISNANMVGTQLFGLLLVIGAALKALSFAGGDLTIAGFEFGLISTVAVIFVEIFAGLWLVYRSFTKLGQNFALLGSVTFSVVHLYSISTGSSACGCFGKFAISELFVLAMLIGICGVNVIARISTRTDSCLHDSVIQSCLRGVCIVVIFATGLQMLSGADLMRVMFADYLSYSRTYQIAENARTVVRQIQVPSISLLQRKVIGAKASCNSRLFGIVDSNQTEQSHDVFYFQAYVDPKESRDKAFQFKTFFSDGTAVREEVRVVRR